jgi:hypothetical protein
MRKNHDIPTKTNPGLEYAAILSGLSMGGDFISESDILQVRQIHSQKYGANIGFNFAAPSTSAKR